MSHAAKINLSLIQHDYLGLLFTGDTEVTYSNQVGGTSCCHPLVEGFFVLLNGSGPELEKDDPFYDDGPTTYRSEHKDRVNQLIDHLGLGADLEAPEVHELKEDWWAKICEAWIPIKVRKDASGWHGGEYGPLHDLKGRVGILTYPNSD